MDKKQPKTAALNRRKFLGLAGAAAALGAAYYYGVHPHLNRGYTLKHSREMMGTIVSFTIIGDDEASQLLTREYREPFVVPEIKI